MACQLDAYCSAALFVAEFGCRAREEAGERALAADDNGRPTDFDYWCDVMIAVEALQGPGPVASDAQNLASFVTAMRADLADADLMMSR